MSDAYIRCICRKLKCSKKRKKEIKRQLMSDMGAAIDSGETAEQVKHHMGSPWEVADEFNQNFSDLEKRKYKREKLRKILVIILVILAAFGGVVYWLWPKPFSVAGEKELQIVEEAKAVIALLDAGDYEALALRADNTMEGLLVPEVIEPQKAKICQQWGALVSCSNAYVGALSQMGKKFWVVQINVSYENVCITYTITFDEHMQLAGLYMK